MINELKAKKNRIIQSSNEILCEADKKKEEADLHIKTKNNIEAEFKKYIQNMNDAATNILRDYEENVKVKQICTIIQNEEIKDSDSDSDQNEFSKRRQKTKKLTDDKDKLKSDELEKYEEANYKLKSKISIKNIIEIKDYYIHQQDTQTIFIAEISDLEKEMDEKKQRLSQLKDELTQLKLIKNNRVLINNFETGEKVMVPEEQVDFYKGNKTKTNHLKDRIKALSKLSSEALLVISRIAFQLKENQQVIGHQNILQVLSFCGLRLEYITNVLFKNRIYRLRQDPGVEDLGLKNICYVQNENDKDPQAETQAEQKYLNSKNDEAKFHIDTRKKIKDVQKAKANANTGELALRAKLLSANQLNQDEMKTSKNIVVGLAQDLADPKLKKKIKKLINIFDSV